MVGGGEGRTLRRWKRIVGRFQHAEVELLEAHLPVMVETMEDVKELAIFYGVEVFWDGAIVCLRQQRS